MKGKQQVLVIRYISGKKDVVQLDVDFSPVLFADDTGVLNVRCRFNATEDYNWHYFPLANIQHYHKQDGDFA